MSKTKQTKTVAVRFYLDRQRNKDFYDFEEYKVPKRKLNVSEIIDQINLIYHVYNNIKIYHEVYLQYLRYVFYTHSEQKVQEKEFHLPRFVLFIKEEFFK